MIAFATSPSLSSTRSTCHIWEDDEAVAATFGAVTTLHMDLSSTRAAYLLQQRLLRPLPVELAVGAHRLLQHVPQPVGGRVERPELRVFDLVLLGSEVLPLRLKLPLQEHLEGDALGGSDPVRTGPRVQLPQLRRLHPSWLLLGYVAMGSTYQPLDADAHDAAWRATLFRGHLGLQTACFLFIALFTAHRW